jgi:lysophospholipase L1-like esterase
MRSLRAVCIVALVWGCSKDTAPGAPAQAAEAPTPAASVAPPVVAPAEPAGFAIEREGGLVVAAEAERVLHVGDSMVPLVGNYLRKVVWSKKRKYYIQSVASSSSLDWGSKRWLQDAMYKYDPDLILISLGSNELFDPNPGRRTAAVKQMVDDTRGRACMWIGPPLWKKDTGIVEVVKKNLGHCRYFDSAALSLPRMEDGRHPNWTGGWRWANAVWKTLGGTETVPADNPAPGLLSDPAPR